ARDVVVSPDGSKVFVTGVSDGDPSQTDFATVAYAADTGARLWAARLNGSTNSDDYAVAVRVSPDGEHVFVTGRTCAAKGTINCTTNLDYLTVSYDTASGAEEWRAVYGGAAGDYDTPTGLAVSSDGEAVVVT